MVFSGGRGGVAHLINSVEVHFSLNNLKQLHSQNLIHCKKKHITQGTRILERVCPKVHLA